METTSDERLVYESVRNRNLSWVTSQNSTENKIRAAKDYYIISTLFLK